MDIILHNSEKVYQGRAFDVRRDEVQLSNGRTTNLDIVEHVGAVTILPIDSEGWIWFVRQYRHPTGGDILELPAGTLEKGEAPEACAYREIQEEIGMAPGTLHKLGEFFLAPGYSTEYMHVYLARDLKPSSLPKDEDEILIIEKLPVDQAMEEAASGGIQDAKTIASLFLFQSYMEKGLL